MTTITALGIERTRLDERLAQLKDEYRSVFGEDISIEADDIDGQWVGIEAEHLSDIDQLVEAAYNSLNPQTAIGVALSRLVQLNGIRRIEGLNSLTDVLITGTPDLTINAGSIIQSAVDNTDWVLLNDATIGANGGVVATVQCTKQAAILAEADTLTKIKNPVFGWETVTNPNQSHTIGRAVETDEELRARRRKSTATPAQTPIDAVYGAISNLKGVRLARVYENATNEYDANGMPPHSMHAIVEGGNAADIAQTIWLQKTIGATLLGSEVSTATDIQGLPHPIRFSRPTYVDPYIVVYLKPFAGYPSDAAKLVKDALVAYGLTLNIGETLLNSRLYTPVNEVLHHSIEEIRVGLSYPPILPDDVIPTYDKLIRILTSRVEVVILP